MANAEGPATDKLLNLELRSDGVAVITLDNGKVNPLSVELLTQIQAAATECSTNGARAVVLAGNDRAFAAGADISQFTERGGEAPFAIADGERITSIGGAFLSALNAVASLRCPTIAAISGVALGGGCELAMACDFRVAGPRAKFGQPEILLGIIPGGGGTQRLARLVGPSRAKDLVFTGRMIGADEAFSIGLADRVTSEDSDALSVALEWAAQLAVGPRSALALAKEAIDGGLESTLQAGLELEQRLFVESFTTRDATVGVESFLANGPGKAKFD
ncbi:MAG TPA: enoyl-CoA hydratase/isomerase family protein [Microthrixaceae bacterium]|nr:enoyl-CoA hydratase/isomerase family protein [Microthrixaceae bacterium]